MRSFVSLLFASALSVVGATNEQEILADVKAPEGFDVTVFAAPPMANYPVFVAAAPDGTLYVSSDGNGSLGRDPNRGRVLRLRDLDGDGRADESKEFVKNVDSPRGLVWDHDRLYLLHPPHISEYIDKDGDGVAEESRILVKNIAFTFKDRPADHTSNGMELGIDGWLYCAIGDFGFMEAEGTDGRKLQLRGGGIVRVRPDGTGLHLYSRGTRNIVGAAVSPLLDIISRDNTNDGGGWDVRLHHNTGLAEHGYPSLYKNFADEIIQPIADYGGGSGCGAAWIDEPGIPAEWNNAPFTCDWGRNWVYMHPLTPKGATFTADQKQFIGLTRPTDLDVDAQSRIYVASWRGATFNYNGPNAGYIVQLRPKNYTPSELPNFEKESVEKLLFYMSNRSHRVRLAAQRALFRHKVDARHELRFLEFRNELTSSQAHRPVTPGKVAAVFASALLGKPQTVASVEEYFIRALGEPDRAAAADEKARIVEAIEDYRARVQVQAILAAAFQNLTNAAPQIAQRLASSDPIVVHTARRALSQLRAYDSCFQLVDSAPGAQRHAALGVLSVIHEPAVVDGLIARLNSEPAPGRRRGLFTALARLHFKEGVWKGDSWGTRPDTSGPYYQAEKWEESAKISRALHEAVAIASAEEFPALLNELNRHKIHSEEIAGMAVAAAAQNDALLGAALTQIAKAERTPPGAEALLLKAAAHEDAGVKAQAVGPLMKIGSEDSLRAAMDALAKLDRGAREAREEFLRSPVLEKHISILADANNVVADAALPTLSERRNGNAEAKAAIEAKGKIRLLKAIEFIGRNTFKDRVVALADDPDPEVAKAARETARELRIDLQREKRNTTTIANLPIADAVTATVAAKGNVEAGKKLFTDLSCVNCHTVSESEPQKGPYLGNIAATYGRTELAESILIPSKSIAQGFAANRFIMKNGDDLEGFVTLEAAEKIVIRDITAQEITLKPGDIEKRQKLERSLMPEGLAATLTPVELASLLDYLQSLNKQ